MFLAASQLRKREREAANWGANMKEEVETALDEALEDGYSDEELEIIDEDWLASIGMSFDDKKADLQAEFPNVEDYVDVDDSFVKVDVSRAVEEVWLDAKKEIALMVEAFEKSFFGSSHPSIEMIVEFMLGPSSELFRVFFTELDWTHDDFKMFMHTFFVHCAYRLSASELYASFGYVKVDWLMPEKQYVALWKQVGEACLPEDEKASRSSNQETFWMKVETAINEVLRHFVVESLLAGPGSNKIESLKVVFDEDKMHFAARA